MCREDENPTRSRDRQPRKDEVGVGRFLSGGNIVYPRLTHLRFCVSFQTQSSSQSPRLKIFTLFLICYSLLPQQIISCPIFLIQHVLSSILMNAWIPILTTIVISFFPGFLQLCFFSHSTRIYKHFLCARTASDGITELNMMNMGVPKPTHLTQRCGSAAITK